MPVDTDGIRLRESVALRLATDDGKSFDLASLLLHVLLFKRVVLKTTRMRDVKELVLTLGASFVNELLDRGALSFTCEANVLATTKGTADGISLLFVYGRDWQRELEHELDSIKPAAVSPRTTRDLRRRIAENTLPPPSGWLVPAIDHTIRDCTGPSSVFDAALEIELKRRSLVLERKPIVTVLADKQIKVELPGLPSEQGYQVGHRAVEHLARVNRYFLEVERFGALQTLNEESYPLVDARFVNLVRNASPSFEIENFKRVETALSWPDLTESVRTRSLDTSKFLALLDSDECTEFRRFLAAAAAIDTDALVERATSLRSRIASVVYGPLGRVIKVVAMVGLGAVVPGSGGAMLGAGLDIVDEFLLSKLLPVDGVATFVGKLYPSVFSER